MGHYCDLTTKSAAVLNSFLTQHLAGVSNSRRFPTAALAFERLLRAAASVRDHSLQNAAGDIFDRPR